MDDEVGIDGTSTNGSIGNGSPLGGCVGAGIGRGEIHLRVQKNFSSTDVNPTYRDTAGKVIDSVVAGGELKILRETNTLRQHTPEGVSSDSTVHMRSYIRRDGAYVPAHRRAPSRGNATNKLSCLYRR